MPLAWASAWALQEAWNLASRVFWRAWVPGSRGVPNPHGYHTPTACGHHSSQYGVQRCSQTLRNRTSRAWDRGDAQGEFGFMCACRGAGRGLHSLVPVLQATRVAHISKTLAGLTASAVCSSLRPCALQTKQRASTASTAAFMVG